MKPQELPIPAAVFFDWDATLANSDEVSIKVLNHILATHGIQTDIFELEANAHNGVLRAKIVAAGQDHLKIRKDFWDIYNQYNDAIRLYPGAEKLLVHLDKTGVPAALISNKPEALLLEEVSRSGTKAFFHAVIGKTPEDSIFGHGAKPGPEPAQIARRMLRLGRDKEIWGVGNSVDDFQGFTTPAQDFGRHHLIIIGRQDETNPYYPSLKKFITENQSEDPVWFDTLKDFADFVEQRIPLPARPGPLR